MKRIGKHAENARVKYDNGTVSERRPIWMLKLAGSRHSGRAAPMSRKRTSVTAMTIGTPGEVVFTAVSVAAMDMVCRKEMPTFKLAIQPWYARSSALACRPR